MINRNQLQNNRQGFTLLEIMVALVVLTSGVSIVVAGMQAHARSIVTTKYKSSEYSTALIHKGQIARGVNPEEINFLGASSREIGGDELSEGETRITISIRSSNYRASIGIMNRESALDDSIPSGHMIGLGSLFGAVSGTALNSPILKHAGGVISASWFPSFDFVTLPTNPSGTRYFFTQDGTDPNLFSQEWVGQTVRSGGGGVIISDNFRIVATHPDPLFADSPIVSAFYSAPALPVTLSRTGTGAGLIVDYFEVTGGSNEIILNNPFDSDFGEIRYTSGNATTPPSAPPTLSDSAYASPFHLPVSEFEGSGAIIVAKYIITNPYFSNPNHQQFNLSINPLPLPAPVITATTPFFDADAVTITVSGANASEGTLRSEGDDSPPDPSASSTTSTSLTIDF